MYVVVVMTLDQWTKENENYFETRPKSTIPKLNHKHEQFAKTLVPVAHISTCPTVASG